MIIGEKLKTVSDLCEALKGIVGRTQIIMDIRLGKLKAQKIGKKLNNAYLIEDAEYRRYIRSRRKWTIQ